MAFSAVTERGSAVTKTSGTTLAVSPSANLTVGKIVFAECATDNTATTSGASTDHTSVTDTHGHTWTKVFERTRTAGGVAADGVTTSKWWTLVTTQIGTGDSVTLTIGTARLARIIGLWEVTIDAGTSIQIATGTTPSVFTEASVQNPTAQATSGLSNIEHLHVGTVGKEEPALTWIESVSAAFTNVYAAEGFGTSGDAGLTNIVINVGTRIATSTGETFDPGNIAAGARDICMSLVAFEEVSTGATGTVAVTQDDQTSTASGTVLNPITGTVAVTQAAQTSTASAVETFTATSAATQDAQTSTASGTVANPVTGNVAVTQADQSSTASGAESFTGSSAAAQADQTSTASGLETITGTSATTQADQTSTASAVVGDAPSGTVAVTQADQTSTASGTVVVVISGSGAVTQADQTSTATAFETFTGSSVNVQADQGAAIVGVLGFSGSSTATQDDQTSTATGTALFAVTGTVAVIQADQFSTASGIGGILTFWSPNPVGYTVNPVSHVKAPVAFVKVGAGDDPPW